MWLNQSLGLQDTRAVDLGRMDELGIAFVEGGWTIA